MILDFVQGDTITEYFALASVQLRQYDQGEMLRVEFTDASGRIDGIAWDNASQTYSQIKDADVVKVQALVSSYRDKLQLKVMRIRKAEEGEYDIEKLLRVVEGGLDKQRELFDAMLATIDDKYLSELLRKIRNDDDLFGKYLKAPAGKRFHHDYIGGLAEHSISMANLVSKCCEHYPELDRDLTVCGALLHDIGKVHELAGGTRLEYTDAGKLIGHITLGDRIVADLIATIPDFPEKLENKLRHMIVSHHGERQYGSPVVPMTREAYVLHFVDKIDSGLNVFSHYEKGSIDDWSNYVNLWERFLYFG